MRLSPLRLRDAKPFVPLLRLTLCSDFSFKLIWATEPILDRDFCERDVDFGLSDSDSRLCTGLVTIEIFMANNNSAFNASQGVNWNRKKQSTGLRMLNWRIYNAHVL